jgi:hypothetical protein
VPSVPGGGAINNATGSGCRLKNHAYDRMATYDSLPREIRDKLKIANSNICARCIGNRLRREGLDATLEHLDRTRHYHKERMGREVIYVWREDLKP